MVWNIWASSDNIFLFVGKLLILLCCFNNCNMPKRTDETISSNPRELFLERMICVLKQNIR